MSESETKSAAEGGGKVLQIAQESAPIVRLAFKILFSKTPGELVEKSDLKTGVMFRALFVLIALAILLLLANSYVEWSLPLSSIWAGVYRPYLAPELNYGMIFRFFITTLVATVISYAVCHLCTRLIAQGEEASMDKITKLSVLCGIASASSVILATLAIQLSAWASARYLEFHIELGKWVGLVILGIFPIAFSTPFHRLFVRAGFENRATRFRVWLLASYVAISCVGGGLVVKIFTESWRTEINLRRGRAQHESLKGVLQHCEISSGDVVCALTLWPVEFQDFELFGSWKSAAAQSGHESSGQGAWAARSGDSNAPGVIKTIGGKDLTVQIAIAAGAVCNSVASYGNSYFPDLAVDGRYPGEYANESKKIIIHLNNTAAGFHEILRSACLNG